MKSPDIAEDILLVREVAATPAAQRVHHFCQLYHERVITTYDLPTIKFAMKPVMPVKEGDLYPVCFQLQNKPSSFGCAHRPAHWNALKNVLTHLQETLPAETYPEVAVMSETTEQHCERMYGINSLDFQMANLALKEKTSAEARQKKQELADEHTEMVQNLFTFADRVVVLLNCA
jgi:hypothetical protein